MNVKTLKAAVIATASVLLAMLIAIVLLLNFTFAAGGMYPKNAEELDLRGKDITLEDYQEIAQKLPGCRIYWDVPFQGSTYDSLEAESIQITSLTDEEVALLSHLTGLKTIDARICTDYDQLYQLQLEHPEAEALVNVPIGGETYDQNTRELNLTSLSEDDARSMRCLPNLEQVDVSNCDNYPLLMQLQQEFPQWNLSYTVELGEDTFDWDSQTVSAEGADYAQLEAAMAALPNLTALNLKNPDAQAEQLMQLRQEYPEVDMHWEVELYGMTFGDEVTEVDISGNIVGSCEEVEAKVACLPQLEKLIMTDCGIDNETMAAYRERQRENYKVVWTIYFTKKCKARTDDIYFMPTKQGEYYFKDAYTPDLKYLEDLVAIDLGHHSIRNIEFLKYMPKVKYLVLAHTDVRDFSPIVHCQELIFLEVGYSAIPDFTPLTKLKKLEDLNINHTYVSVEPLKEMTWLKVLWAPGRNYSTIQELKEALPNTRVENGKEVAPGNDWRELQNYYDSRDILGMHYMK